LRNPNVAICERRSGADIDAEEGHGDGSERSAVEGLGLTKVDQVERGHLEGFVCILAGQAAEFLGKGVVADELLAGYLAGGEQKGESPADFLVLSDAFGVPGRLVFVCGRRTARDTPLTA
jgi:hypothetical protein